MSFLTFFDLEELEGTEGSLLAFLPFFAADLVELEAPFVLGVDFEAEPEAPVTEETLVPVGAFVRFGGALVDGFGLEAFFAFGSTTAKERAEFTFGAKL